MDSEIQFTILKEIGKYNSSKDNYYDTSSFTNNEHFLNITGIKLYLNESLSGIIGIELIFNENKFSSGIFKSKQSTIINDNSHIIEINGIIDEIEGSFKNNKITKMLFKLTNGTSKGFDIENKYTAKQLTHYKILNKDHHKLTSLKLAFELELTFFCPVFITDNEKDNTLIQHDKHSNLYSTNSFGKIFNDSTQFILPDDITSISSEINLQKIICYYESNILKGIQMEYSNGKKAIFGSDCAQESAYIEIKGEQCVEEIIVRSGDMIDGIIINVDNAEGKLLIAGGNGGGAHYITGLKEKKRTLFGFEGYFSGFIHQMRVIFK